MKVHLRTSSLGKKKENNQFFFSVFAWNCLDSNKAVWGSQPHTAHSY